MNITTAAAAAAAVEITETERSPKTVNCAAMRAVMDSVGLMNIMAPINSNSCGLWT